jgi:hypothetical protein
MIFMAWGVGMGASASDAVADVIPMLTVVGAGQ